VREGEFYELHATTLESTGGVAKEAVDSHPT